MMTTAALRHCNKFGLIKYCAKVHLTGTVIPSVKSLRTKSVVLTSSANYASRSMDPNTTTLQQVSTLNSLPLTLQARKNSTVADKDATSFSEEAKLSVLDAAVVRQIKTDLIESDANSDGRINSEELKELLKKHNAAFTDKEIVEIGELFYASKAGGSVSFERFIEAIDYAAARAENRAVPDNKDGVMHYKETTQRHPLGIGKCATEYLYGKSHGLYTSEELNVKLTHLEPKTWRDKAALKAVKAVRFFFDIGTGWNRGEVTSEKILQRAIFLETIAGVPGMVAAISRHFRSLRTMQRDGGMLNMFLEEANNERMHLLTFVKLKDPGYLFRIMVVLAQFGFGSAFFLAYMVSPAFCHRFVGYIEEEACTTYTKMIKCIENAPEGHDLANWRVEKAPKIAISYWHLGEHGTVLDLFYAVRADEAEHRDVNHCVSGIPEGAVNPLYDPEDKLDQMLVRYVKDIMKRE